jgi:hypothetical protein
MRKNHFTLRPMQRLSGASRPRRFSPDNQAMPIIVACGLSGKACGTVKTSEVSLHLHQAPNEGIASNTKPPEISRGDPSHWIAALSLTAPRINE